MATSGFPAAQRRATSSSESLKLIAAETIISVLLCGAAAAKPTPNSYPDTRERVSANREERRIIKILPDLILYVERQAIQDELSHRGRRRSWRSLSAHGPLGVSPV